MISGVYFYTNNGQNWSKTSLNNQTVTCFAFSGNYIFAGTYGDVYLSTNNGQNWMHTSLNKKCFILNHLINKIFAATANNNGLYL